MSLTPCVRDILYLNGTCVCCERPSVHERGRQPCMITCLSHLLFTMRCNLCSLLEELCRETLVVHALNCKTDLMRGVF